MDRSNLSILSSVPSAPCSGLKLDELVTAFNFHALAKIEMLLLENSAKKVASIFDEQLSALQAEIIKERDEIHRHKLTTSICSEILQIEEIKNSHIDLVESLKGKLHPADSFSTLSENLQNICKDLQCKNVILPQTASDMERLHEAANSLSENITEELMTKLKLCSEASNLRNKVLAITDKVTESKARVDKACETSMLAIMENYIKDV